MENARSFLTGHFHSLEQTATLEKTLTQLQSTDPTPERDRKISWLQAQLNYTRTSALPDLACRLALLHIRIKGLEGEVKEGKKFGW